jgi:hypothetical protein
MNDVRFCGIAGSAALLETASHGGMVRPYPVAQRGKIDRLVQPAVVAIGLDARAAPWSQS